MGPRLILMEFDDVIVVTSELRRDALRQAMSVDGIAFSDARFDQRCTGVPFRLAARTLYSITPSHADETAIDLAAVRAARHFKAALTRGALLVPGIADYVQHQSASSRLGLVAAAPADDVMPLLVLAGVADSFSTIVCNDDDVDCDSLTALWTRARVRLSRGAAGGEEVLAIVASAAALGAARAAGCQAAIGSTESLAL